MAVPANQRDQPVLGDPPASPAGSPKIEQVKREAKRVLDCVLANKIGAGVLLVFVILAVVFIILYATKGDFRAQRFQGGHFDLYADVPYSTLPNGIAVSGTGDALYGASAAFKDGRDFYDISAGFQDINDHSLVTTTTSRLPMGPPSTGTLANCPPECYDICVGADVNRNINNPADINDRRAQDMAVQEIDSQLVYSTFTDSPSKETMYEDFADAIQTNIVAAVPGVAAPGLVPPVVLQNDELPWGWGKCSDKKQQGNLRQDSDEFLVRRWGGRIL